MPDPIDKFTIIRALGNLAHLLEQLAKGETITPEILRECHAGTVDLRERLIATTPEQLDAQRMPIPRELVRVDIGEDGATVDVFVGGDRTYAIAGLGMRLYSVDAEGSIEGRAVADAWRTHLEALERTEAERDDARRAVARGHAWSRRRTGLAWPPIDERPTDDEARSFAMDAWGVKVADSLFPRGGHSKAAHHGAGIDATTADGDEHATVDHSSDAHPREPAQRASSVQPDPRCTPQGALRMLVDVVSRHGLAGEMQARGGRIAALVAVSDWPSVVELLRDSCGLARTYVMQAEGLADALAHLPDESEVAF